MFEHNGFTEHCDNRCWQCKKTNACENYNNALNESNYTPPEKPKYKNVWEALKAVEKPASKEANVENAPKGNLEQKNNVIIEKFIKSQINQIVNRYYKSDYDTRRMIKYLKINYNGGLKYGWTCEQQDNDLFYIYGNMRKKNIDENIRSLSPEKSKEIKKYIADMELYELDGYLNIYDRCNETGNRFSNYVISKINPLVHKSPSTKKYYINARDIKMDKLSHKAEIINRYNKYIKEFENENINQ